MDNFINLAQKGYAAYEQATQQSQQNQGSNSQQQQPHDYQQKEGQESLPVDHGQAAQIANNQSGASGNNELFAQAMAFLGGGNHSQPVNEEHVTDAHSKVYSENTSASNVSAEALGSAAALETLKKYMSSSGTSGENTNTGGDFQSKMIGMAMSEAATLFDKTGHTGDKQDAVNGAAATMFKMLFQSKFSGGSGGSQPTAVMGGGNSGGLGQLLEMASQYTKSK
ncbi:hypothetical protein CPB86DRAFT_442256 [Serendipita vermifera]|nr:hypothetical protein CPB86DRAFT_442256 [Serendipita vermifera]